MPSSPADSKGSSSSTVVTPDLKAGLVKSDSIISEQVVRKTVDIFFENLFAFQASFRISHIFNSWNYDYQSRMDEEVDQLLKDIRRIGTPGEPEVLFGNLFDDDEAQQYYEALVGTLKSAKKRGLIAFKGQMLLKGMHDNVMISIVDSA